MVHHVFSTMRSAAQLHYHALLRHSSSVADPNAVAAKKPLLSRLFTCPAKQLNVAHAQPQPQSQTSGHDARMPRLPLHVHAGVSVRASIRHGYALRIIRPRPSLAAIDATHFDAEDEFEGDAHHAPRHCFGCSSLRCHTLFALGRAASLCSDSCSDQPEERNNDHIVAPARVRSPSLVAKLQPIDEARDWSENSTLTETLDYAGEGTFTPASESDVDVTGAGDRYTGDLVNGLPHGRGQMFFSNGDFYVGAFVLGVPHGDGVMVWIEHGRYEGQFENGLRHGHGYYTAPDGHSSYRGEWQLDARHGEGEEFLDGRLRYSGQWLCNERHGHGRGWLSDGSVVDGEWRAGKLHGSAVVKLVDHTVVDGQWKNGKLNQRTVRTTSPTTASASPALKSLDPSSPSLASLMSHLVLAQAELQSRLASIEKFVVLTAASPAAAVEA